MHPIPIKRRKRQVMFWLILCGVLFVVFMYLFVFALLKAADDEDYTVLHFDDSVMHPITTPVPAPPEEWVKYPVPLDDALQQFITQEAIDKGVAPSLVFAIIEKESNFDPNCIGDNGNSFGLMQIWASEHTERCHRLNATNLLDPYQNVMVGIDFLAELLDMGSLEWALEFYSGGNPDYAEIVKASAEMISEGVMVMSK